MKESFQIQFSYGRNNYIQWLIYKKFWYAEWHTCSIFSISILIELCIVQCLSVRVVLETRSI